MIYTAYSWRVYLTMRTKCDICMLPLFVAYAYENESESIAGEDVS